SYPRHQPYRQLDGEHHVRLRHLHRSTVGGGGNIGAGLPLRAPEPPSQLAGRIRHRGAAGHQLSGSVDPRSVLITAGTTTINHDINIILDMSHLLRDTRRTLQPAVTQRHLEAEVAHCVGGVTADPGGVPRSRACRVPSGCSSGAFSHRLMYSTTQTSSVFASTALTSRSWSTLSKNDLMSRSSTQSFLQHRARVTATASNAERPGR